MTGSTVVAPTFREGYADGMRDAAAGMPFHLVPELHPLHYRAGYEAALHGLRLP